MHHAVGCLVVLGEMQVAADSAHAFCYIGEAFNGGPDGVAIAAFELRAGRVSERAAQQVTLA